jgi:hypothetical protein
MMVIDHRPLLAMGEYTDITYSPILLALHCIEYFAEDPERTPPPPPPGKSTL